MERIRVNEEKEINRTMDILDKIFHAQKQSREQKVQNFNSIFAEDVAVDAAMAKAKQVEEMERLKSNQEKELEALQDKHDRENERLAGAKEKESEDDAINKKRDAERKASEKQTASEGKLISNIQHVVDSTMKAIGLSVKKEIEKNQEKGLGMLNTLGSFVGYRVTDKAQEKGKLFLKFGDDLGEELQEVTSQEVKALNKLSKDMQKVLQGYLRIVKMGDNELKNTKYNNDWAAILKARDAIVSLIGRVNTQKLLNKEDRNYKKEYENYHSDPEQIKRRAKRNEARRMLKNRKGIKGKDVHHKDNNPMNNDKANLSIVSQNFNRKEPRLRETLSKSASIGEWIKDFEKSDAPQFKGQSADQIKKMAVAAYYANQKGK